MFHTRPLRPRRFRLPSRFSPFSIWGPNLPQFKTRYGGRRKGYEESKVHHGDVGQSLFNQRLKPLIARGVRPVLVFSVEAPVEEFRSRFRANGVEVEAINYGKGIFH